MANLARLIDSIVEGIGEQIDDLGPGLQARVSLDAVVTDVASLQAMLAPESARINAAAAAAATALQAVHDGIADGSKGVGDLGPVLGQLETLDALLDPTGAGAAKSLLAVIVARITNLLSFRPDVQAILGDLAAIKNLRGGPADSTAFHDVHVLQIAFKNVWMEAFDENLRSAAEKLYTETAKLHADAGVPVPDPSSIEDLAALQRFLDSVRDAAEVAAPPIPANVQAYLGVVVDAWGQLSDAQRAIASENADAIKALIDRGQYFSTETLRIIQAMEEMVKHPNGTGGKIAKLITELSQSLAEPYAFDVFAADSYNFGLLLTYRQEWTPQEYQAGDLRATIPLAPGETRKYSKRKNVKVTRSQREIEKSMQSSSLQTSDTQRSESDIMQKSRNVTNFKMTADTSFKIGIFDIHATSEFVRNQESESETRKKDLREMTLKAAQEYKLERSLEVDTTSITETDETESGEISNPNSEITVTYLFYELQRRYKIREYLYRVRPVILVAQDVPAPHEITEAWLIQHQWILARVLLDDSLRPALEYLSSGFAGDEVSLEIVRAHWEHLRDVSRDLEAQVSAQIDVRNFYRDQVANLTLQTDRARAMDSAIGWAGKLAQESIYDVTGLEVDNLEANRKYTESLLQNVNDNIADLQNKLKQAADSYQAATSKYSDALQRKFTRTVAIDQLRIHVKQNILYYMQAIWAHEPPDQRFFRLYNKQVSCPSPAQEVTIAVKGKRKGSRDHDAITSSNSYEAEVFVSRATPVVGNTTVDLITIADVDNVLGCKGNYLIFPLKQTCYLTTFMLQEFISDTYDLRDPDRFSAWKAMGSIDAVAKSVVAELATLQRGSPAWEALIDDFAEYINATQGAIDEIIIPTGQLFIEALPGAHPLLEDFKLLHRAEDVRKVKAEVRHAELENLRLAARLAAAQSDPANIGLLEDPDIEKKIIVEGDAVVNGGPD